MSRTRVVHDAIMTEEKSSLEIEQKTDSLVQGLRVLTIPIPNAEKLNLLIGSYE